MKLFRLWPLLLAFVVAASAHAQTLSDRITVNVVEVPVYVMRNTGGVVKDLKQSDFELFVNGKPHPIDYFDVIVDDPAPAPAAAAPAPAARSALQRRRLYVLLFDTLNADPHVLRRARATAREFVDSAPPGDTFAVAVYRRSGIQFVVPFTNDRVALHRAVTTLRPSSAGDAFSLATLESERDSWLATAVPPPDAMRPDEPEPFKPADTGEVRVFLESRGAALAEVAERQALSMEQDGRRTLLENSIGDLASLARRMAPLPGVKHVVLLSPGMVGQGSSIYYHTRKIHEAYRAAGVILNAVNFANPAPWKIEDGGLASDPAGLLKELAADTGGTVTTNLASLRKMESVTYVLGFRAPADQKKNNSIDVRVKNAPFGAVVRHRRSYSTEPRTGTEDTLFLADVIANDIPQTGMTVDLDVEAKGEQATLVAKVPGVELLAHGSEGKTAMDVFLYVFDAHDVATVWTHVRVNLDHEKGREFLSANAYPLRQRFSLPPGRYVAKTLLRVVGTDVTGFERREFVIAAR